MRAAIAGVLVALALPATALSKTPVSLEICGADDCRTFSEKANEALVLGVAVPEGYELSAPPPLYPYFRLRVEGGESILWVPQAGRLRPSFWVRPSAKLIGELDIATARLEPFPPPALERVTVAGRPVGDPDAFKDLFAVFEKARPVASEARSVDITVRSDWVNTVRPIDYFPLEGVLHRYGEWVRPSDELAERIEDELAAQAGEGRPSWPAYLSLFALLGAGATILWLMWGRRRWRARAT